jgi:PAS domain S-box-containing protein
MALAICGAVLLVSVGLLLAFQWMDFRATFERDIATLAAIIGNNSHADLEFGDDDLAGQLLQSLKAKPSVVCARLVNAAGRSVAHYGKPHNLDEIKAFPADNEFAREGGNLLYTAPVRHKGEQIGRLYLRADYSTGLKELFRFYGAVMTGIVLISLLLALRMSARMEPFIVNPLLSLAKTAQAVGEANDYSVRSPLERRGDELGVLAKAFNRMLGRIQDQDTALNLSQQKLESLVNSIDGIVWEWNPADDKFTFVSRQAESVLGYPVEQWLNQAGFWDSIIHPSDLAAVRVSRLAPPDGFRPYRCEFRMIAANGSAVWIRESSAFLADNARFVALRGTFQNITESKNAAEQLDRLNRQLMEASRQAGMAEVATGVLHNVGNVLNSVNISANLLSDRLAASKLANLVKAAQLLRENSAGLASFLTNDPRGARLPGYIAKLADHLHSERQLHLRELESLGKNIEHMKQIVAMQQNYASLGGLSETFDVEEVMEDALRINETSLMARGIRLARSYSPIPPVTGAKHKVLQILVNLSRNAIHAIASSATSNGLLAVAIQEAGHGRLRIEVRDNGVGIAPENLTRIFQHGFTTKGDGHGFGLHSSANAAAEMGGSLTASSDGPGRGAVFTLELRTKGADIPPRRGQPQQASPAANSVI